jgi:hypothetical protein
MTVTRDGLLLWGCAFSALVAYLLSIELPPTQWDYHHWLQFASAVALWVTGKFQVSKLPSTEEVNRGITVDGKPLTKGSPV